MPPGRIELPPLVPKTSTLSVKLWGLIIYYTKSMVGLIFYISLLIILTIFLLITTIFFLSLIYSSSLGSPYIPSKQKEVDNIFKEARLKKGKIFLELGCGDGRVVRTAICQYGVKGIGVDINPILIFYAKILAKFQKIKNIELRVENIFDTKLSNADYIYLFLMPALIGKLKIKMDKELKKGVIIISHGFPIIGWEKKMYHKIPHSPFPTYFYRT